VSDAGKAVKLAVDAFMAALLMTKLGFEVPAP